MFCEGGFREGVTGEGGWWRGVAAPARMAVIGDDWDRKRTTNLKTIHDIGLTNFQCTANWSFYMYVTILGKQTDFRRLFHAGVSWRPITRDENLAWNNYRFVKKFTGYCIIFQGKYKMRADLRDRNGRIACLEADVEIPTYLSFLCRVAHKSSSLCSPQNMQSGATRTSLLHPALFLSFSAALLNVVLGGYRWEKTLREVAVISSWANTLKSSLERREIQ